MGTCSVGGRFVEGFAEVDAKTWAEACGALANIKDTIEAIIPSVG